MARPERILDPSLSPVHAFADELRKLRLQAGNPKYSQMARATGRSRTALTEAAGGDHLPTWETTEAYVKACGGDLAAWLQKWEDAQDATGRTPIRHEARQIPQQTVVAAAMEGSTSLQPEEPLPGNGLRISQPSADVLLRMWQEQRDQARQCENQRAFFTAVVVVIGACAFTYSVVRRDAGAPSFFAAMVVGLLGLLGTLMSSKYYERFQMHMTEAEALRRRLDAMFPELCIEHDWMKSRNQHRNRYSRLYNIRLHQMWTLLHAGIAVCGLGLILSYVMI